MALIVFVSHQVKGNVTLLIIGVMIGYLANAIIGILKFFSVEEDIKAYVIWGLGSFSRVSGNQMMLFVTIMAILLPPFISTGENIKPAHAGRRICPEFGSEHKTGKNTSHQLFGSTDSHCHCLLRTGYLSGFSRTSPLPGIIPDFRPPDSDASLSGNGCSLSFGLQYHCPDAGV